MAEAAARWRPSGFLIASLAVHASSAAGLLIWPQHWPWFAGAMVADHAGLTLGGLLPRSRLIGGNLRDLRGLGPPADEVVLTFDDGPHPEVTPRVLSLLERAGCSASFFFVAERAARQRELVAEVLARGHSVENHTYSHPHAFAFYSPRGVAREIDRAQETLAGLSGVAPRYFRAPAGIRNLFLDPLLQARGLPLVSWTRRGFDTVAGRPEPVARRLLRGLAPGDILMLHDGTSRRGADGEPVVLEALRRVLEALARRGLRGVGLPAGAAVRPASPRCTPRTGPAGRP